MDNKKSHRWLNNKIKKSYASMFSYSIPLNVRAYKMLTTKKICKKIYL